MFVLGITGGIGCGKSTLAKIFQEYSVPVLDADRISHEVTQAGSPVLTELRNILPENCFQADGSLAAEETARLIFNNKKMLDAVSLLIHEEVTKKLINGVQQAKEAKLPLIVLDVPLPVKQGFLDQCDYVVVVWANAAERLERLEKRGLNRTEAEQRIACQMSKEEYAKIADRVIDNSGDIEHLYSAFHKLVKDELNSRGIFLQIQA